MRYAHEIIQPDPVTVSPDLSVTDLARLLLEHDQDGFVVVEEGRVVGVVTAMDLIFQEKRVHLPSFITVMEVVVPVGHRAAVKELEKVTGSTVRDIMTPDPYTVAFDAGLDRIATLMVEKHVSLVPVLKDDVLIGVVTKRDVLRAAFSKATRMAADEAETEKT